MKEADLNSTQSFAFIRILDTAVFCGSLNCSEKADTCTVSKISNEDLSKIIITHECKLGDEVLLSVQSEKKNPFKIYVKTVSTSSIRKSTAEDTRRIQDEIQANFAKTYNNIHNKIRDNMLDNFGNAFRNSWRFSGFRPETNLP